jgi:hypothetical protein
VPPSSRSRELRARRAAGHVRQAGVLSRCASGNWRLNLYYSNAACPGLRDAQGTRVPPPMPVNPATPPIRAAQPVATGSGRRARRATAHVRRSGVLPARPARGALPRRRHGSDSGRAGRAKQARAAADAGEDHADQEAPAGRNQVAAARKSGRPACFRRRRHRAPNCGDCDRPPAASRFRALPTRNPRLPGALRAPRAARPREPRVPARPATSGKPACGRRQSLRLSDRVTAACRGVEAKSIGVDAVELPRDTDTAGTTCRRVI